MASPLCINRLACVVIGCAGSVFAQAPGLDLSLEGAVRSALLNNRELSAARYAVEKARGRLVQSGRWSNPEIGASGMGDFAFGNNGETAFSVGIYQTFPVTARLGLSRRIGRLDVERALREVRNHERLLVEKVQTQYIRAVAAVAQAGHWRRIQKQQQEMEEAVRNRVNAGQGSSAELALAISQTATTWSELNAAEVATRMALIDLKTLLGYPAEHPLRLTDSLASVIGQLRKMAGDRPRVLQRPDADLLVLEADRADLEIRLARAEAWEGVRIGVEYVNEQGVDEPEGLGTDQFLGVTVSLPLPLWNSNQGSVAEKQALRSEMQARLDALRLELTNDLAAAIQQVQLLRHRVEDLQSRSLKNVRSAEAELQEGFGQARVDLRDLLAVKAQLAELEIMENNAQAELALALVRLLATTGAHPALASSLAASSPIQKSEKK